MNRIAEQLLALFTASAWWSYLLRIAGFYALAWLVHLLSHRLARRLVRLSRFTPQTRRPRPERRETLRGLFASAISVLAFTAATLASLGQFVDVTALVWMVGLFSAAFGLGVRPLISDVLAGVNLIFEDTFAVGEKVEMLGVEGVIEAVNLRTTWMRAPTGELYIVPNGEVRMVRNFSRGRFSTANITLKVAAADLSRALPLLEELGQEAVVLLPNLLEPWQVISESGLIGQQTELTLLAQARFGQAAEMRPRLLALVQERLVEAGIELVG
ncbi:MAG: mechanosensitive ion channel family protein [Chloroflexi bacterium]|nr:mechanosensitive ion channel family protein [Chloroflexota bacterium]